MPAVVVQNLSKIYPNSFPRLKKILHLPAKPAVEALKNISFEIGDGEIFGLIGKNGAGKTTLTKIIATLVQPTDGRISVKGFDSIADEVKVRSLIGLATAEERSFYWRLTAEQNMLFFARLYGLKDAEAKKRIGEVFERLNLTELKNRRFAELSTGNKQKLAVARALLPAPPVLLLDEPTRSLDPLAAAEMRDLVRSLKGVSVLLTSHNLSEIEELCNRVAIISKGEIRVVGTPTNLRFKHKQSQKVEIIFSEISEDYLDLLCDNLSAELPSYEIKNRAGTLSLFFQRESGDDLLGKIISYLTEHGAKVLDIETEKPTLLDILESYDK